MRPLLRQEGGYALVTAIAVLAILISFGLAAAKFADGQQHAAGAARGHEAGFNQAEAVLNAQVFQLARAWPGASTSAATYKCLSTTTGTTTCPDPTSLSDSFTGPDFNAAGCTKPVWRTYVQDDDDPAGGSSYYDPAVMNPMTHPQVPYDANKNNNVWVRAETAAQCRRQVVVGLATRAVITLPWPTAVMTANWFKTTNNGKKVIINTQGPTNPSKAGNVSIRCQAAPAPAPPTSDCKHYQPGQISPDTVPGSSAGDTPVVGNSSLVGLKERALSGGIYKPAGDCSAVSPAVSSTYPAAGTVIYYEGPCTGANAVKVSGNSTNNRLVVVIGTGEYSLGGNSTFYGLVYAANLDNSSAARITLSGCARIQGMVAVDGNGGVNVGSCKSNLVYDPTIMDSLTTFGGVTLAKNSFRTLPGSVQSDPSP
jgi:hypothetical protein